MVVVEYVRANVGAVWPGNGVTLNSDGSKQGQVVADWPEDRTVKEWLQIYGFLSPVVKNQANRISRKAFHRNYANSLHIFRHASLSTRGEWA